MKYFVFILIILPIVSCRKPIVEPEVIDNVTIFKAGKMQFGQASASLNNKTWTASSGAYIGQGGNYIDVSAITFLDESFDYITEIFTFTIPNRLNKYTKFTLKTSLDRLDNECLVRYALVEHDVPLVNFELDTTKNSNYIEVTFLDSTRITTNFDLTFKSLPKNGKKDLVYHFENGKFDAKIIK